MKLVDQSVALVCLAVLKSARRRTVEDVALSDIPEIIARYYKQNEENQVNLLKSFCCNVENAFLLIFFVCNDNLCYHCRNYNKYKYDKNKPVEFSIHFFST